MPEAWSGAVVRAGVIAAWIVAFAVVSIAGVWLWSEWRTNVAEFTADLDPRPRGGWEEFPDAPPDDVTARVASAREGLAWVNRRFAVNGGTCAAIGAGLIAVAVIYRRRLRRGPRPTWRTGIFVLPLVAVLAFLVLAWLVS
jgi:hypothetical protein